MKPVVAISVRDLIEFMLRRGDLLRGSRFVASDRMVVGTKGHQSVQKSRPPGYEAEVPVVFDHDGDVLTLRVQGRIDGLWIRESRPSIEEIKTVQEPWSGTPRELHWAQARSYAAILSIQRGWPEVDLQLTYLELDSQHTISFQERADAVSLTAWWTALLNDYLPWALERMSWQQTHRASLEQLVFPYPQYRAGQRRLAVEVFKTLTASNRLFVEAPTGIGKTISVLFPTFKASARHPVDKVFYLTAKISGQSVAESALRDLAGSGLRCRSLTLSARSRVCQQQGVACDPSRCTRLIGYYDRWHDALRDAFTSDVWSREAVMSLADRHHLCPAELALDLVPWADVIIGDYNYAFDPAASLRQCFEDEQGRYVFLVDEAHNLVDRARDMFSATMSSSSMQETADQCEELLPSLAKALQSAARYLRKIEPHRDAQDVDLEQSKPERLLLHQIESAVEISEAWLATNQSTECRESVLQRYFEMQSFLRAVERAESDFALLCHADGAERVLQVLCLHPGRLLGEMLKRSVSAVFFSATLSPSAYFQEMLGGQPGDQLLQLASPFPPNHLHLLVHERIATKWKNREQSAEVVAQTLVDFTRGCAGHYLLFFPSYAYLELVRALAQPLLPEAEHVVQSSDMSESDRREFLEGFRKPRPGRTLLGWVVMGGQFAEAIDLVGENLIGAVVVGVGLPMVGLEREVMRRQFESASKDGFAFAYVYPGLNRVLQAVGRVIRSETDRGAVLLIDNRWSEARYRELMPPHWSVRWIGRQPGWGAELQAFWRSGGFPKIEDTGPNSYFSP